MKYISLVILTLSFCIGCTKEKKPSEKEKLSIQVQIIPEGVVNDIPYHALWWEVTNTKDSSHFKTIKDPEEIWCVILNSRQDTLGYYTGGSTPMPFTYFNAADSIINIQFMIGIDFFSSAIKEEEDYKKYLEQIETPIEFEPVEININQHLGDTIRFELLEK